MAMDATLQIRIDSAVKEQVEALYRNLGTSFAEAVRMFAQQSLQEGGMPFRPSLRAWDDMSEAEISEKLSRSSENIAAGRISAQCDMDAKVGAASESCRKDIRYFIPQQSSGILRKSLCTLCSSIGIRLWQNGGTTPLHFATGEFDCISG